MAEDLQGLIEKINEEGIRAAESKAKDIENEAGRQAGEILSGAKKEAEGIIAEAEREVARMEKSGEASLKQAGRDLLLSMRKEINTLLDRLLAERISETLTPAAMAKIITSLVKSYKGGEKGIAVSLNKGDLQKMEKGMLGGLKGELKKGLTLRPSDDIRGGFVISYDSGKSHYDFTDAALAEYLGSHLKPKLREILKDASSGVKKQKK